MWGRGRLEGLHCERVIYAEPNNGGIRRRLGIGIEQRKQDGESTLIQNQHSGPKNAGPWAMHPAASDVENANCQAAILCRHLSRAPPGETRKEAEIPDLLHLMGALLKLCSVPCLCCGGSHE
jgi:hypothetical protein